MPAKKVNFLEWWLDSGHLYGLGVTFHAGLAFLNLQEVGFEAFSVGWNSAFACLFLILFLRQRIVFRKGKKLWT